MTKLLLTATLGIVFLYSCDISRAEVCPKEEIVKENLGKLINREFRIQRLRPVSGMEGLCEVVVKVGLRPFVLYTDGKGENFLVGEMVNASTKENLTRKTVEEFMTVSGDILQKLETLVNMTYGKGEKYVYYVVDPDCPFCKRFSPMLKEWASKKGVQVKVILYPLPIHPQAKPKTVAMVCDGRGYDDIHKNINTKNQCEKGKRAIEENLRFLQSIGVSGTPTVIGMNGRYVVGLPRSTDELDGLIR